MWEKYKSLLNDIIVTKWLHSMRFGPGYVLDTLAMTYRRITNQKKKQGGNRWLLPMCLQIACNLL